VDSSGTVQDHRIYDSFGNITAQTNAAIDFLFAYTGQQLDRASGLYYDQARFYDDALGRFLTQDPTEFMAGDPNLYRYVSNNPTNLTDPNGEEECQSSDKSKDDQIELKEQYAKEDYYRLSAGYDSYDQQAQFQLWKDQNPNGWDSGNGEVNHNYDGPARGSPSGGSTSGGDTGESTPGDTGGPVTGVGSGGSAPTGDEGSHRCDLGVSSPEDTGTGPTW
jgi:RHS repeat-associated protein